MQPCSSVFNEGLCCDSFMPPAVTLQRSLPVFFSLRGNFEKFPQIRNFGGLLGALVGKILRFE